MLQTGPFFTSVVHAPSSEEQRPFVPATCPYDTTPGLLPLTGLSHSHDHMSVVSSSQMLSSESHEELETLLNMEMKLRLLDLENISIPETPPQIPVEPPNFNFVYDFS